LIASAKDFSRAIRQINHSMRVDRRWCVAAYASAVILLITFIVRTAWLCDDAYITARTIDNWLNGNGLRWNALERVQTFTHPLWLFVEAAAWRMSGGFYWSSIVTSVICASAGALLITRIEGVSLLSAAALFFLCTSQAFIDFATSGLETPLSYLLLAASVAVYLLARSSPAWILWTMVLASLVAVNRLDNLVLVAPLVLHVAIVAWRETKWQFVLGLTPLLMWEAFSIIYYGFPVPNTAYAKLATGIPQSELTTQGLAYLLNSWHVDPSTLVIIGIAILAALWFRSVESLTISGGLFLHLAYVVRVGGAFMTGRFLAPAVIVAVGLLLHEARTTRSQMFMTLVMLVIGCLGYPHAASRVWRSRFPPVESLIDAHGIADERLIYARNVELPGCGGVVNARAISRAYAVFAGNGRELGLRPDTLEALFDVIAVGDQQLELQVLQLVVVADDREQRVGAAQVAEQRRARSRHVDDADRRGGDLRRRLDEREAVEAIIGDRRHPDVLLHLVLRRVGVGQRVEERGLARAGQADDADVERHTGPSLVRDVLLERGERAVLERLDRALRLVEHGRSFQVREVEHELQDQHLLLLV